jgi:homospermidine synthase
MKLKKKANIYEILAILEISINILKSRVKLKPAQKRKLATYAYYLRELSRKKQKKVQGNISKTREGAILPALIIHIVAQAIASLLTRKND